jgi:hypothetical protein
MENGESEMKVKCDRRIGPSGTQICGKEALPGYDYCMWHWYPGIEKRVIALERGLEGLLRRLEASTSPDDEAGWFGRPE